MTFRRALFIRFGGLGDILLATPALRAVHQAFPGIEIDFVVGKGRADILAGHPNVRRIIPFDKQGQDARPLQFLKFLSKLSGEHYDLVVNLHPSAKSYAMCLAAHARKTVTFRKRMELRVETGRVLHAVDDFLKDLAPLGIGIGSDRGMDFIIPASAVPKVETILQGRGITDDTRLVVINPAASRPLNRWPLERFAAVAAHFASLPGVAVVVTGAPSRFRSVIDGLDDSTLAEQIASCDPRIGNLAGKLTIKEFGALLARADTLLTCDTGPMQIGAAVGVPLVVLSGGADPDRTGPLTANSTVLIDRTLPCVPCRDRVCARGDVKCMDNLSVENVIAAVTARLEDRMRSKRGTPLPVLNG